MRAFLFDLDDTLFDHRYSTRVALAAIREHLPSLTTVPLETLEQRHGIVLEELHQQVLSGALDIDTARTARFRRLVELHGGHATDAELEAGTRAYRAAYLAARRAISGAVPVLCALRAQGRIAIVSNNLRAEQADKMTVCGIGEHVDVLVVSEEASAPKPHPAMFLLALEELGVRPQDALMIGDSWTADIEGARAAGIRAIWFNPLRRPCPDPSALAAELHAWEPVDVVVGKILEC